IHTGVKSNIGDILVGNWYLIGATRSGTTGRVYRNGQDVTASPQAHADILA
ncbi:unnamed protein product, partial [marine sediment metagenome]